MLRVRFIDGEVIEYPDAHYAKEEKDIIQLYDENDEDSWWITTVITQNVKSIESCNEDIEDPIIFTKQNNKDAE